MQTLLVAPQVGLQYAINEVQHVVNSLHPRLLMGEVTLNQVVTELQREEYGIVWFATHGDGDGIALDDGKLTASMLAQLLRPAPPQMLFLNTCSSFDVARLVHDSVRTAIVGTVCDVPDRAAFVTGAVCARVVERQLAGAAGFDVVRAYEESKPAGPNQQYILLNGSVRLGGEQPQDDVMQMMLYILQKQDVVVEQLSGENATLHQELAAINAKIDGMGTRFHPRLTRGRLLAWMLGYIIFGLAGLLFQPDIASWLGLRWYVAISAVSVIAALAGALLVFGLRFSWDEDRRDQA